MGYHAWLIWNDYQDSENYYDRMRNTSIKAKNDNEDSKESETGFENGPDLDLDWDKLNSQGIVAWIYACDGKISYPVCYKQGDNSYYLHRLPDGTRRYAGSIFLDGRCDSDLGCLHNILYGHNMRNGSMFKHLHDYEEDGYYKDHKNFYVFTQEECRIYRIFSIACTEDGSEFYRTEFGSFEYYKDWISWICENSDELTGTEAAGQDTMTLSTCTNTGDKRLAITGYLEEKTILN